MATIKKIPSTEKLKVTCRTGKKEYVVTKKVDSNTFYLYEKTPGGYEKLSPRGASDPTVFDEIIWGNK